MKNILIKPDVSVKEGLKAMGKAGEKCLIVADEKGVLCGSLSDGDLRKAILSGVNFKDSISGVYNSRPKYLKRGEFTREEAKAIFLKERFDIIPVVDCDKKVVDVLFWNKVLGNHEMFDKKKLDSPVVIMAGGSGTRLEPFTKVLPKPLIPIHEKTVIELIIERFTEVGVDDFHLTINYKSRIIKAFFEELEPDYSVSFVVEHEPLGTAGSLRLLKGKFDIPFLVTNCDIIIDTDYAALYDFHKENSYDITLVASSKEYIIPYGTCELNSEGHLDHIKEKPEYHFLVNTGLYVLSPEVLSLIPENKFYHITHLIEDAKQQGKRIGVYPINDEAWIDVGQWTEYKRTVERIEGQTK